MPQFKSKLDNPQVNFTMDGHLFGPVTLTISPLESCASWGRKCDYNTPNSIGPLVARPAWEPQFCHVIFIYLFFLIKCGDPDSNYLWPRPR